MNDIEVARLCEAQMALIRINAHRWRTVEQRIVREDCLSAVRAIDRLLRMLWDYGEIDTYVEPMLSR